MISQFQRRAAEAVTAAVRRLGGEIEFRDCGLHEVVWLGEATCSRGSVRVYLYEDDWSADFVVGDSRRVFEKPDFDSANSMICALCEELELQIAQGPYPFFSKGVSGTRSTTSR